MTKKLTKKQYDLFYDIIERKSSLKNLMRKYNVSLAQLSQWLKQNEFKELFVMSYQYNMIQFRYQELLDAKIAHAKLKKLLKTATGDLLYKVCDRLADIPDVKIKDDVDFWEISEKDEGPKCEINDNQASAMLEALAKEEDEYKNRNA